jgi:signal transduction histidine kinase
MRITHAGLRLSMLLAALVVAGAAYWDEERESRAALDDFASEQAALARSAAAALRARLASAPGASERGGFEGLPELEQPSSVRVLVRGPQDTTFRTSSGQTFSTPELEAAYAQGASTLLIPRDRAKVLPALGLPVRTAGVGLAHLDAGAAGHWGVAVVSTAERLRDREKRARWRLVLAVALASLLVLAFGGLALRLQRQELLLEHRLEMERRLTELSRAATTLILASGMAHEIGTPLGVIAGRAEQLAARVRGDERAEKSVRSIQEQAEHIHEVIRGFLKLAKGGSPNFERVSPEALMQRAAALVEHRFARAGVRLEVVPGEAGEPLWADARLLEHALVNLLLNACDASPAGAEVRLRLETTSDGVRFLVVDEGTGIPEAVAAQAIQPFFTTKPEGAGTGLGLAIVNEIAKSHHGKLALGPHGSRGTLAQLELPLGGKGEVAHG